MIGGPQVNSLDASTTASEMKEGNEGGLAFTRGPGNYEFMNAIRSAIPVFRDLAAEMRREVSSGRTASLIDYLRSDRPLNETDRMELADLLAGELGLPPGRPELTRSELFWQKEIAARTLALADQLRREGKKGGLRRLAADRISDSLSNEPGKRRLTGKQIDNLINFFGAKSLRKNYPEYFSIK
jgi:hypothetical protein